MDDIDNEYNENNTMITKSPKAKACENVLNADDNANENANESVSLENRVKFIKVASSSSSEIIKKKEKKKEKKQKKSKKRCNHVDGDCKCKTKISISMRDANICVYCNTLYCNTHRLPEHHNCKGDYRKIDVDKFNKYSGLGGGIFKKIDKI